MGRIIKITFAVGIILLLATYISVGLYMKKSIDGRLSTIEAQVALTSRKKDALSEQSLSLEMLKKNLTAELALEKDLANQRALKATLTKLASEERDKYMLEQQSILEQQRIAEEQRLAQKELLRQQAIQQAEQQTVTEVVKTVKKKTTSAS